jgi:hypothetical protein
MFFDNYNRYRNNNGSFYFITPLFSKLLFFVLAPSIFFGGVAVKEYQKPDSFIRVNTDAVVVFFLNTYAGKFMLNPQKYEHCITNAKANTPPRDVLMCFVED